MSKINNMIPKPIFYFIEFKNIEKLKSVLRVIANKDNVLIDNDFGLLVSGKEFLKICDAKPGWDWAKE